MAKPMTNADNFWLSMDEPTNLMVITAFMEFTEPLDYNGCWPPSTADWPRSPVFKKGSLNPNPASACPTGKPTPITTCAPTSTGWPCRIRATRPTCRR